MPAFLDPEFWSLANPELWVAVGLLAFIAILIWAGAHNHVFAALDAKAAAIQQNLDEAARLRADAEAMLATLTRERDEAAALGAQMLKDAEAEARRLETEAKARLEEQIARHTELANRRIALAEQQAAAEVKAAAADLATQAAETILRARLEGAKSDPLVDRAVSELPSRLQ